MNFKLIAIRPIKNCDKEILKALIPNCIYQFYNEYDFYYNQNNNGKIKSYIDYQKQNLLNKKELRYATINAIKRVEEVPENLYESNINISAIVGQNGSGKSSLLEIYYYLMYKYAIRHQLVSKKEDLKSNKNLEVEIFYEDKNHNIIVHQYSEKKDYLQIYDNKKNDLYYLSKNNYNNVHNYQCYTIALNYSIYGLNSTVSGNWLDALFHKNDGYRTPIVINPYRENGNIDINNEYILAQSRLLLNYYLIDNKTLLDNVHISSVKFQLDLIKHQYISQYDSENDKNISIPISAIYKNLFQNNSFFYQNITNDREVNFLLKSVLDNSIIIDYKNNTFTYKNLNGTDNLKIEKNFTNRTTKYPEFKVLNGIYILKKIYKITQNYKEYEIFKPLFTLNNSNKSYPNTLTIDKKDFIKIYSDYFHRTFKIVIEEYFEKQKIQANDFSILNTDKRTSLILYLENLNHKKFSFPYLFDFHGSFSLIFNNYFDISFKHISRFTLNHIELIINNITKDISNNGIVNLKDMVFKTVNNIVNDSVVESEITLKIDEMNTLLFLKLYSDESHITFKLKQAISYFNGGFFENIENYSWNQVSKILDIELNQNYLKNSSIETMPLAFTQPIVMVVKTNKNDESVIINLIKTKKLKEYPFSQLSSGEQQLIHSILTVIYHIFNLKSIEGHYKQDNINIIFDEIELYFHPEYQRIYINNLIRSLNTIDKNKELKFNILLSTHSPFVLSDIPSQNILKLEEGIPINNNRINSFAANIYDLLKDEFFLKNGAIGAFASNKISQILDKTNIDQKDIDVINLIGDPFLKGIILNKLEGRLSNSYLEQEINRLKKLQQKRSEDATN